MSSVNTIPVATEWIISNYIIYLSEGIRIWFQNVTQMKSYFIISTFPISECNQNVLISSSQQLNKRLLVGRSLHRLFYTNHRNILSLVIPNNLGWFLPEMTLKWFHISPPPPPPKSLTTSLKLWFSCLHASVRAHKSAYIWEITQNSKQKYGLRFENYHSQNMFIKKNSIIFASMQNEPCHHS